MQHTSYHVPSSLSPFSSNNSETISLTPSSIQLHQLPALYPIAGLKKVKNYKEGDIGKNKKEEAMHG